MTAESPNAQSRSMIKAPSHAFLNNGFYLNGSPSFASPGFEGARMPVTQTSNSTSMLAVASSFQHSFTPSESSVDKTTSSSAANPAITNKVKRPLNAFFLYRADKRAEFSAKYGAIRNQDMSKIVSQHWRNESAETRKKYEQMAADKYQEHFEKNPDFVWMPKYRGQENRAARRADQTGRIAPSPGMSTVGPSRDNYIQKKKRSKSSPTKKCGSSSRSNSPRNSPAFHWSSPSNTSTPEPRASHAGTSFSPLMHNYNTAHSSPIPALAIDLPVNSRAMGSAPAHSVDDLISPNTFINEMSYVFSSDEEHATGIVGAARTSSSDAATNFTRSSASRVTVPSFDLAHTTLPGAFPETDSATMPIVSEMNRNAFGQCYHTQEITSSALLASMNTNDPIAMQKSASKHDPAILFSSPDAISLAPDLASSFAMPPSFPGNDNGTIQKDAFMSLRPSLIQNDSINFHDPPSAPMPAAFADTLPPLPASTVSADSQSYSAMLLTLNSDTRNDYISDPAGTIDSGASFMLTSPLGASSSVQPWQSESEVAVANNNNVYMARQPTAHSSLMILQQNPIDSKLNVADSVATPDSRIATNTINTSSDKASASSSGSPSRSRRSQTTRFIPAPINTKTALSKLNNTLAPAPSSSKLKSSRCFITHEDIENLVENFWKIPSPMTPLRTPLRSIFGLPPLSATTLI